MKVDKKYYSIKEVSNMLDIKEHVIRHWDSKDPKTNELRIENLSKRTKGGTRFFSKSHIKRIKDLKKLLKIGGKRLHSLNLAQKIISDKKLINNSLEDKKSVFSKQDTQRFDKIRVITNNLKFLIKNK